MPILRLGAALLLGLWTSLASAGVHPVTDQAGRIVQVPWAPQRVFPVITMMTPVMAALAPEQMTGLAFRLAPGAEPFLPPRLASLPVVPVLEGLNGEAILAMQPDLAIGWAGSGSLLQQTESLLQRLRIPLLLYAGERLADYPATFRALGQVLGRAARGEQLARELEDSQQQPARALQGLAHADRPRVYYAESPDGLTSQCSQSSRVEVVWLAGGRPVPECADGGLTSHQTFSFERLLVLDPDVILARSPVIAARLRRDSRWQRLRAVREQRVYGAPGLPFNWVDRPPSFMRALGARWLARQLHPARFSGDFRPEVQQFLQTFFAVTPSAAMLTALLEPGQ